MHVDGFRFDLASALTRSRHDVDMVSPFLNILQQDPVLSGVKLIAEPWDLGPGGYRVGGFPPPWSEWNDRYRNGMRDFWRGASEDVRELASRLTGSGDLFATGLRRPYASINYVTSHDGFTLRDLVSYDRKHNEPNAEGGRDGVDDNRSWNCGVEGESGDAGVVLLRRRQMRNMLTTLLLSTGVPMLLAGDEFQQHLATTTPTARTTQRPGWTGAGTIGRASSSTSCGGCYGCAALIRCCGVNFFAAGGSDTNREIAWFAPDGREMDDVQWYDRGLRTLGMFVNGGRVVDARTSW